MKQLKAYSIHIAAYAFALFFTATSSFGQCYDIYALSRGGGEYNAGAIVKTDEHGSSKKIYSFTRIDASRPSSQFCLANDGSLYALSGGGKFNQGVLFQWDPKTNEYTRKISFKRDYNDYVADSAAWAPHGPLIQGVNGKFYGMTRFGGRDSYSGVIFEWDALTGNYSEKHWFDSESGREPLGALVQSTNGLMYGMTSKGGVNDCGVLFEWDPESGIFLKLLDFDSTETGFNARGSLCEAGNGKLYGTTRTGGLHGHGVLFEYNPVSNNFMKIHDFNGSETGSFPESSLTLAENGKFYGTTNEGGLYGYGVLFELDLQNNEFQKLLDFDAENGINPVGPLTLCENGLLVGVTLLSVFEFDPELKIFNKKCDFEPKDLLPTSSLVQAKNGRFYGFSGKGGLGAMWQPPLNNYGVIYEWDPILDTCIIRLKFMDSKIGDSPTGLIFSENGKLYGTAIQGDDYCSWGSLFEFDPEKGEFQKKSGLGVAPRPLMKAKNGNFYGTTGQDYGECTMFPTLYEWNPLSQQIAYKYLNFFPIYYPKGNIPAQNGHLIESNNSKIYFGADMNEIVEWDVELDTLIIKYKLNDDDGRFPELILKENKGSLLGRTERGGLYNRGTLFEWETETDHFNKLLDFTDSTQMFSLIQADDSLFYGVSNRGSLGLFYEWNQKSHELKVLHRQNNIDHYNWTFGNDLTLADNGKLYGTLNTTDSGFYLFEWNPLINSINRLIDLNKAQYIDLVILKRYSTDTINITSCNEYVSPSGKHVWSESGVYQDTIQCITGCDSLITINLNLHNSSTLSVSETSCNSFISPSGKIWSLSGIYTDTLSGIAGCDSIIIVTLSIPSVDVSVNLNNSVLSANASNATYQWIDCDNGNSVIEGETHQFYAATENGSYAVIVSQHGCTDTSACVEFYISNLIDNDFGRNITIYPNPNDGKVHIDMGKVYPNVEIIITKPDGQVIQKSQIRNSNFKELQLLESPGIYFIILTSKDNKAVFKIVRK